MTPNDILREASRRKIRLTPDGPRLIATCPGKLPADMERKLVKNKLALLKLLNEKRNLARQVLDGEFNEPLGGRLFGLICSELVIQYHDEKCRLAFEYLRAARQATKPQ
jgi:predicted metal-dependent hydrolase